MSATAEQFDLAEWNQIFETTDASKIVNWSLARWGDDLVMSSSFGAESAVLLHMASLVKPNIKVIFVNTGYLFPETHRFMEDLRLKLNLNVWIYRTRNDPIGYLKQAGEDDPTHRKDVNACCAINKNEPFERAMMELKPMGWLRGIRRDQNEKRESMKILEWSPRYDCYAISPLLNWKARDLHAYLKRHDLPYHPLWEKGYASIGCNPLTCTRAIGDGEDTRDGRWAGQDKVECGINLNNSLDSANL